MTEGILNINKPEGWTSQDVCAKLRHRLHIRKIGHTGTLDPMATGVLPVCIGKATRIIEYYDKDLKTYHAGMKLGYVSDTLDIWGDVHEYGGKQLSEISEEEIIAAFSDYTGEISQIPPKYSALKINGKRAYDLARNGEDFEIKPRVITIAENRISNIDMSAGTLEFDVTCSKGTYIRTICDDIGRTVGCGALMSSLERTASGYFSIDKAIKLEELIEMTDEQIESLIIPMDRTLINLGMIELDNNRFTAFVNGNSSGTGYRITQDTHFTADRNSSCEGSGIYRVYCGSGFLGTGYVRGRDLIPAKVIAR